MVLSYPPPPGLEKSIRRITPTPVAAEAANYKVIHVIAPAIADRNDVIKSRTGLCQFLILYLPRERDAAVMAEVSLCQTKPLSGFPSVDEHTLASPDVSPRHSGPLQ